MGDEPTLVQEEEPAQLIVFYPNRQPVPYRLHVGEPLGPLEIVPTQYLTFRPRHAHCCGACVEHTQVTLSESLSLLQL